MPSITVQVAGGNKLQLDVPSEHLQVIAFCCFFPSLLASARLICCQRCLSPYDCYRWMI